MTGDEAHVQGGDGLLQLGLEAQDGHGRLVLVGVDLQGAIVTGYEEVVVGLFREELARFYY